MNYLETQLNKKQKQIQEYESMNGNLIKMFEQLSKEKKKLCSYFFQSAKIGITNKKYLVSVINRTCQSDETPKKISSTYIKELKEYNELRDAGLRLAQIIADEKQCKIKDVFEEIGYSMKD
ncbi:Sae3p [Saccharomyces cerevisiae Vin13]|nr:Sae3p [Saccharomyces cerevisiae Vin13]